MQYIIIFIFSRFDFDFCRKTVLREKRSNILAAIKIKTELNIFEFVWELF